MSVHNIVYHLNAQCVRYRHLYLFIIGLVGFLLMPVSAMAETGAGTNNYKNGWNAYQSGQYVEAARLWQELSQQANNSTDNNDKLQAAFAAVLTTIAWEKAGYSQAYSSWSDAIRLYLEAGTQWEQQRDQLKKRIGDNRDALRNFNSDTPVVINPLDQLLLMVDDEVKLADYNGPRTGLQQTPSVENSEDVRGYFGDTTTEKTIETPIETVTTNIEPSIPIENLSEVPLFPATVPVLEENQEIEPALTTRNIETPTEAVITNIEPSIPIENLSEVPLFPATVPVLEENQENEPALTTRHIIPIEEPEQADEPIIDDRETTSTIPIESTDVPRMPEQTLIVVPPTPTKKIIKKQRPAQTSKKMR